MRKCSAILFQSFGAPDVAEEVIPFLRRVTAGRNVPENRLLEVAEHYYHCGGASPLNAQNNQIISALQRRLAAHGYPQSVYYGTRNSSPFVVDALERIVADGHQHVCVWRTSAWGGYSGQIQYDEDITHACELYSPAQQLNITVMKPYYHHTLFLQGYAASLLESHAVLQKRSLDIRDCLPRIFTIFTAHSVPVGADYQSELYASQVEYTVEKIVALTGIEDFAIAWQSRSGPAYVPWLEPDITDVIAAVDADRFQAICIVPCGFITDHMEVIWDLDHEAMELVEQRDLLGHRAPTIGLRGEYLDLCVDIMRPYL